MICLGVLADVLDHQRGLDQRCVVERLFLHRVAQDEHVQTCGEILKRHRFGLAVGEKLIAAAGTDDDGTARGHIQLGNVVVDVCIDDTIGITLVKNEGIVNHNGHPFCVRY